MEHLYEVTDDILLSYRGSKNPLIGLFACEDIATHISQVLRRDYNDTLATTVTFVSQYGMNLSYSETCDMVDKIVTKLQEKDSSWLRKRKHQTTVIQNLRLA